MRSFAQFACLAGFALACATPIGVEPVSRHEVQRALSADAVSARRPSISSQHVVLRMGLAQAMKQDREAALATLLEMTLDEIELDAETAANRLFALAEYSYLHAIMMRRACEAVKPPANRGALAPAAPEKPELCERARSYFVAASMYAYLFIFPDGGRPPPSPFDPRFRSAVDLYNLAVTSAIRPQSGKVVPRSVLFEFHLGELDLTMNAGALRYADRTMADLIPAAGLEVRGLRNRYRQAGIGAPFLAKLVAEEGVSIPMTSARIADQLRVPVTVFVRYQGITEGLRTGKFRGHVEIYAKGAVNETEVDGQVVPLEYETSSALAYSLDRDAVWDFEISGFLSGDALPVVDGLLMMEPYQPGKIPLVLVHGTASSPARWAEMLNEFMADPILRAKYQFWIFIYTTGNPILYSAGLLRTSLQRTLAEVDPEAGDPALQRMVIVGHSQGGLLTKLQVISSGTRFWDAFSNEPFEDVDISPETRALLDQALFFEPLPFVERVIFISTPHRGSFLASNFLGRIASRLFRASTQLIGASLELARAGVQLPGLVIDPNRSVFGRFGKQSDAGLEESLARLPSSVDNMNPSHSFIQTLQTIPVPSEVRAHSIIPVRGVAPPEGQNDGVVEYASAHIDEAISEYVVYNTGHSTQGDAETIVETRRILLEHLVVGIDDPGIGAH